MHQKIASITQWWHIPAVCFLCRQYHRDVLAICQPCMQLLIPIDAACGLCRLPLEPYNADIGGLADRFQNSVLCGQCIRKKPLYDQVISRFVFEEPLRSLIHAFKYQENLSLSHLMAHLMLQAKPTLYKSDCLIPVPMHSRKLRKRGFNQAAILTKRLSKLLHIPYQLHWCEKILNTDQQKGLNRRKRKHNLQNAFRLTARGASKITLHNIKHVTIIDDLITTGSTANELAKILKVRGVERVDIWCIARTGLG